MNGSAEYREFTQSIKPRDYRSTMLCFVRSAADDTLEASLDFGQTWDSLPSDEVTGAEVVKQVDMPGAAYQLVRLTLKQPHPMIEIAALSAQVRSLRASREAGDTSLLGCADLCNQSPYTSSGCEFVNCLYWCKFQR